MRASGGSARRPGHWIRGSRSGVTLSRRHRHLVGAPSAAPGGDTLFAAARWRSLLGREPGRGGCTCSGRSRARRPRPGTSDTDLAQVVRSPLDEVRYLSPKHNSLSMMMAGLRLRVGRVKHLFFFSFSFYFSLKKTFGLMCGSRIKGLHLPSPLCNCAGQECEGLR